MLWTIYFITITVIIWWVKSYLKKGATLDLTEVVWLVVITLIPILNTFAGVLAFVLTIDWDKTIIDTRKDV